MSILVTITTVTYNSEETLTKTLESVLNQTYRNIEYFIIDGQSKDNTVEIARSYEEKFREAGISYTIISEPDKGMYDAINKGIEKATGEIIGNINSDDWYESDAIEKVVKCYEETCFDLMYADLRMIQKNGKNFIKRAKKGKIVTSRNWNHPTQFGTKKLYSEQKYKLESLHDDFDLYLRVIKQGYKIVILNEVLANFRMEGMSHTKSIRDAVKRGKARYKIYRNNGYSILYFFECVLAEVGKFILG